MQTDGTEYENQLNGLGYPLFVERCEDAEKSRLYLYWVGTPDPTRSTRAREKAHPRNWIALIILR
jgi:hypothetical protein